MNLDDKRIVKIGVCIAAFTVLLYLGFQNLDVVLKVLGYLFQMLTPFILGICIAFVLNILMKLFENRVFSRLNRKKNPKWDKARRPVCIGITLLLFLGFVTVLFSFLIPQLAQSVTTLAKNLPSYMSGLENWGNGLLETFGLSADVAQMISDLLYQFSDRILNYLTTALPKIFETTVSIASGLFSFFFGFIISIYMLAGKEKLTYNLKRTGYAFLPRKAADYCCHVYHICNERFTGFVSGQLTEAVILGILCFIGMTCLRMPYALLISTIVGITNIVPIIGPIIGTIPGALIILVATKSPDSSPNLMQALVFVIFIIVLQQIESNFIYPRVVGTSVGLPGLWVMFGVLVGGDLFGLPGVVLGVPALSVIYVLLRESVSSRLKERQLKI